MRERSSSPRCVVVGIDGSRSAMHAALWAVDEAIDRCVPLRLVYATGLPSCESDQATPHSAQVTGALRDALAMVTATGKPVNVESAIGQDLPTTVLLAESRSAAMVCVGSTGLEHAVHGRIGSTASALADAALCSLAIVPISGVPTPRGAVLAVVDEAHPSRAVLQLAMREARLRGAQLQVMTAWSFHGDGVQDVEKASLTVTRLERDLAPWRRRNPDVDISPIARHGNVVNYLEYAHRTAEPVHVVVADPRRPGPLDILLGASGRAALDAAGCTLLMCDRHCWL